MRPHSYAPIEVTRAVLWNSAPTQSNIAHRRTHTESSSLCVGISCVIVYLGSCFGCSLKSFFFSVALFCCLALCFFYLTSCFLSTPSHRRVCCKDPSAPANAMSKVYINPHDDDRMVRGASGCGQIDSIA